MLRFQFIRVCKIIGAFVLLTLSVINLEKYLSSLSFCEKRIWYKRTNILISNIQATISNKSFSSKFMNESEIFGEYGEEVILSELDEIKFKREIQDGYKNYAFNEFISKKISLGNCIQCQIHLSSFLKNYYYRKIITRPKA